MILKPHTERRSMCRPAVRALLVGMLVVAGRMSAGAREYETFDVVGDSVSFGINPDYYSVTQAYGWVDMLFGEGKGTNPAPERASTNLWPGIAMHNTAVSGSKAWEWANTNSYSYLGTVLGHHPDLVAVMIVPW